jgi:hypothetical protein
MTGNDSITIPRKVKDLAGHKYGQWTVLQYAGIAPNSRKLTFRGKTQSLLCWAKELGIDRSTLCHRLNRGWSVEKALSKK